MARPIAIPIAIPALYFLTVTVSFGPVVAPQHASSPTAANERTPDVTIFRKSGPDRPLSSKAVVQITGK